MKKLAIAICTYNRPEYLKSCLLSIAENHNSLINQICIYVIDNACDAATKQICYEYELVLDILYFEEKKVGLSNARNRAMVESSESYIMYLDDDALFTKDTLTEVFRTIDNFSFDIFGGSYDPYYLERKPDWLPQDFGKFSFKFENPTNLDKEFISGCIMIIRRDVFEKVGSFNSELGMKGKYVGYGEEDDFQERARSLGFIIGYNPLIKVLHLVSKHKFSLKWHLHAAYKHGSDSNFYKSDFTTKFKNIGYQTFYLFPASFLIASKNLFLKKGYSLNHLVISNYKS